MHRVYLVLLFLLAIAHADTIPEQRLENRSSYFLAPSAHDLPAKTIQISQKGALLSYLEIGIVPHLMIFGGSILPGFFVNNGENGVIGCRISGMVSEHFGLQGSIAKAGWSGLFQSVAYLVPSAGFTVSGTGAQGSLNYTYVKEQSYAEENLHILNASGSIRALPMLSIIWENYMLIDPRSKSEVRGGLLCTGVRYHGKNTLLDFGVGTTIGDEYIPIPLFNITYRL